MAGRLPEFPKNVSPVGTNYQFDHMFVCAKSGKAPGELWYPNGVALDPATNHIYVAEGQSFYYFARVSIFSKTGEYLNHYTHELMKSLWGIAIYRNELYVTDTAIHAVFHLLVRKGPHLVARQGRCKSAIGLFNSPRQLSVSADGDVYVADYENDRIQILDSDLHPIRMVTHPSMHRPCDVKLTEDEMYVLGESDIFCVHVFSYTGDKIRSLITSSEGMRLAGLAFLCLDADKGLVISDCSNQQIKIFSKDGAYLQSLGEVDSPTGLAFVSNFKLIYL